MDKYLKKIPCTQKCACPTLIVCKCIPGICTFIFQRKKNKGFCFKKQAWQKHNEGVCKCIAGICKLLFQFFFQKNPKKGKQKKNSKKILKKSLVKAT